jgi:hypothetical protein
MPDTVARRELGPSGSSLALSVAASAGGSTRPSGTVRRMESRSAAIAEMLVGIGFISSDTASRPNAAVEVLSTLLPQDATIEICLTLEGIEVSDEAYVFEEAIGSFDRPPPHQLARGDDQRVTYWNQQNRPVDRRQLVLCTDDALSWTRSLPRITEGYITGDDVSLLSVPLRIVLGATVHDKRKGIVEAWIDDGPTLSIRVDTAAAAGLSACIEAGASFD